MRISSTWLGVVALVFGIMILAFPALLNWLVGIFLIVIGVLVILRKF
ncbi:MAG: DUF3096 domain-containing protein [Dehalococcoidia bacterium]|nr:DUF3096 domain-containing protein [Dehalococcoidia bacterium]